MKKLNFFVVVSAVLLLTAALATGNGVLLAAGLIPAGILLYAWLSVAWALRTLTISCEITDTRVRRGDRMNLGLLIHCGSPLPIAPLVLRINQGAGTEEFTCDVNGSRHIAHRVDISFVAAHVGPATPGLEECLVRDLFGLFQRRLDQDGVQAPLLVLPLTFEVDPLPFAPMEASLGTMATATEDLNNPSDMRGYQPGDPMKRIHWKLSARKQELMVRRFEEPILPETLILLDCSLPPAEPGTAAAACLRDALLESAASVLAAEARLGHPVHLPLHGTHPAEVTGSMGLPLAMEHIALVDFSETERFERVLQLESRRLRSVGATVVITARLSGAVVETMARLRRLGPNMRLLLVAQNPDDPHWLPYIDRLQQRDIEVGYVRALSAEETTSPCAAR